MTYSIFSYSSPYLRAGLSHVDVVMNPANMEAVFDGILEVIREYQRTGMTEEELIRTKEQLKVELMISSESTRSRMDSNGKAMMYRGEPVPLTETLNRIVAVDQDAIIQSVLEFFDLSRMSISLVGNVNVPGSRYLASYIK